MNESELISFESNLISPFSVPTPRPSSIVAKHTVRVFETKCLLLIWH